jgi:hypothetical protein
MLQAVPDTTGKFLVICLFKGWVMHIVLHQYFTITWQWMSVNEYDYYIHVAGDVHDHPGDNIVRGGGGCLYVYYQ